MCIPVMDSSLVALHLALHSVFDSDSGAFGLHAIVLDADGSHLINASDAWLRRMDTALGGHTTLAHFACMRAAGTDTAQQVQKSRLTILKRILQIRPGLAHARDQV